MAHFVVNLGKSRTFVEGNSFLWAPKGRNAGWKHMPDVKAGDVIFCNENAAIFAIATATSNAYEFNKPNHPAFADWHHEGYRVDVALTELAYPVGMDEVRGDFLLVHNQFCSPKLFAADGRAAQVYLVNIPDAAAPLFYEALGDTAAEFYDSMESLAPPSVGLLQEPAKPYGSDRKRSKPKALEIVKERITKARVGQGWFRDEVLKAWGGTCALTGVGVAEALIASHIVSWYLSNRDEKLDPDNGLPLIATVDRLFDKGLISFADDGQLLMNNKISADQYDRMGLSSEMRLMRPLSEGNKQYLQRHRDNFGFK